MRLRAMLLTWIAGVWLTGVAWAALPPAPSGLEVRPGNRSAVLTWTFLNESVSAYVIFQDGVELARLSTGALSSPAYVAAGLNNGVTYAFTVAAANAEGTGPRSESVMVTPVVLPPAPAGLSAFLQDGPVPSVALQWSVPPAQTLAVTGYCVYRSVSNTAGDSVFAVATNTFLDAGINTVGAASAYAYRVAAVDAQGNTGPASDPVFVSLTAGLLPATASLLPQPQDGSVLVIWSAIAGASAYLVYLTDLDTLAENVTMVPNVLTSVTLPLVNDGRLFRVAVAGFDAMDRIGERQSADFRSRPPVVQDFAARAGNGYVQLTWSPALAEAGSLTVNLYAGPVDPPDTLIASTGATVTAWVHRTTETLFFQARYANTSGEGAPTASVSAVPAGNLPSPPSGFRAEIGESRSITFRWDPNPSEDLVTAYRLHAVDGPFDQWPLGAADSNTRLASAVNNGQAYRFFMVASNAQGDSPSSVTLTVRPVPAPVSFSAQSKGNQIFLSWVPGETPTGAVYNLFRTNAGFGEPVQLTLTTRTQYLEYQPLNGNYFYQLTTRNLDLQPAEAFGLTATAAVSVPPTPPIGLLAEPGNAQVLVRWRPVDNATGYQLYRTELTGSYAGPIVQGLAAKAASAADSFGLTNTVRYYYTLTAVNEAGESTRSAEVSAIPYLPAQLPADPMVRLTESRRMALLQWDSALPGSYPIIGYNLYRSEDGGGTYRHLGGEPTLASASTTITSFAYTDPDLDFGKSYIYRVHPLDEDAVNLIRHEGPAFRLASVRLEFPKNRLDVFRNALDPAKGEKAGVRLEQVQAGRARVKIYTLAGEWVRTLLDTEVPPGFSEQFPFIILLDWDGKNQSGETVASGVYLIHAEGGAGYHQTRKIAVIK